MAGARARPDSSLCLRVQGECDVPHVVACISRFCQDIGMDPLFTAHIATAASELANNLWMHANRGGEITLSVMAHNGGVELRATDDGPGIADTGRAMSDGYSTGGGLGCGLPGVRRLMDEFEIQSQPGLGTRVVARKWTAGRS